MIVLDLDQNTTEWHKARAGMPTASAFSSLVNADGKPSKSAQGYAEMLAGEMYAGQPIDPWSGNQFTEYGHEMEEEAALAYSLRTGTDLDTIGFCMDDARRYGCSPDRLAGNGLLEIKCLPKRHITQLLYWNKNHKAPPDYIAQAQGQLLVTGREWVDLFFYSPLLPCLNIRIKPDRAFASALLQAIDNCLIERDRILKILEDME